MDFVEAVRALLSAGSTSDREVVPKLAVQKGDDSGRRVLDSLLAAHPALRAEVWEALLQGLVNATATAKLARKAAAELTYALRLLAGLLAQDPAVLAKLPAVVAHARQLLWTLVTILTKVHGPLDAAGYPASASSAEEGGPLPAILAGLLEAAAEGEEAESSAAAAAAAMVDSENEDEADEAGAAPTTAGRTGVAARMLSRLEDVVALAAAALRAYAAVPAPTAAMLADPAGGQACPLLALTTSALTILREVAASSYAGNKKLLPLLLAPGGAIGSAAVKSKAAGNGLHPSAAAAAPVLVQSLSASLFELLLLSRDKAVAGSSSSIPALPASQCTRLAGLVDDCLSTLLFSPAAAPHYAAAMSRALVYAQQAVSTPPASSPSTSELDTALGSPQPPSKKSRPSPDTTSSSTTYYMPSILATERKLFDALAVAGSGAQGSSSLVQAATLRALPALLGHFITGWRRAEALAAGVATEGAAAAAATTPGGEAEATNNAGQGSQRGGKASAGSSAAPPAGVSEAAFAAAQAMVKAPEYGFFTELLATATGAALPAAASEEEGSSKDGAASLVTPPASAATSEPVTVVTTRLRATGALVALALEADLYSIHNDPAPHPRTRVLERAAVWALQSGTAALRDAASAGPAALSELLWAWTGALAAFQEAHHATVHAQLPQLLQALLTAAGSCDDEAARPALLGAVSRTLLQSISVCTRLRQLDVFLTAVFEVGQRLSAPGASAAAATLYRRSLASPALLRALGSALRALPPGQVEAINTLLTDNLAAAASKVSKASAPSGVTPSDKAGSKRPRSDSSGGAGSASAAAVVDVAFVAALLVAEALRQFRATAFTAAGGVKTAAAAVTAGAGALVGGGLAAPSSTTGALLLAAGAEVATAAADAVVSCAAYDAVRAKTPTLLATLTSADVAATTLDWPVTQYGAPLGAGDKAAATASLSALVGALPALAAAAKASSEAEPAHALALASVTAFLEARLRLLNTCLCAPPVLRAAVAKQLQSDKADAFKLMSTAAAQIASALLNSAPPHALSGCIDVVAAHAPAAAVAAWTEALLRSPGAPSTRALLGSLRLYELVPVTTAFCGGINKLIKEALAAAGTAPAPASSSKKTPKAASTQAKTAPEAVLVAIAGLTALPVHALLASCERAGASLTPIVATVLTTLAPAAGLPAPARCAAMEWLAAVAGAAPAAAAAALPTGASALSSVLAALLGAEGAAQASAEAAVKALLRAALLGAATAPDAVAVAGGKAPLKALGVSALAEALAAAPLPCPPHLTSAAAAVLEAAPASASAAEVVPRLRLALEAAAVSAAGGAGALKPKATARHLEAAGSAAAALLQTAAGTSTAEGCALLAQLAAVVQASRAGRLAACEALEGASAAPEAAASAAATAAASAARSVCGKLFPAEAGAPWVACVLSSSGSSLSTAIAALLPLSALVRGLLPALGNGTPVEVTAQLARTVIAAAAEAFYARATHEVAPTADAGTAANAQTGANLMSVEALEAVLSAAPKAGALAEAGEVAPGATLVCEGVTAVRPVLALLADTLLPTLCTAAASPASSAGSRSDAVLALHALRELVSHPRVLGVGFDRANAIVTALAPLAAAVSAVPQRPSAVLSGPAASLVTAAPKAAAGALPFAAVDVDVGGAPGSGARIVVSAIAASAAAAGQASSAASAVAAGPAASLAAPATTDTALVTAAAWVLHALVKYHPESSLACMPAVVSHVQTLLSLAMTPLPATPANGRETDGFLPTTTNSILVRLCEQLARHVKTARHYAVHVLATFLGAAGRRDLAGRPLFAGRGEEELLPAAFALFSVCKSDEMQQLYILLSKRPSIQALLKAYHRQYSEGRYTGKA